MLINLQVVYSNKLKVYSCFASTFTFFNFRRIITIILSFCIAIADIFLVR